jgi:drug/metabolite transporter (DMT)-like permease
MAVGPSLIMMNQYILKALDFPYPMFLSGLGVLCSGLLAKIAVKLEYVQIQRAEAIEGILWYRRVLPVGLAHAATLSFGNMVYLHLDVGFIQMLKAFSPVFIMLTGYLASVDTPSQSVILSVLVIAIGTAATCSFTPRLNLFGLLLMGLAESTEAIRLIITQFFLQQLKFGIIEGQYVLAPASAFWLFLASVIFEFPTMIECNAFVIVINNPRYFIAASFMGIGVSFITFFVIQATSSLTMKILGTLRNIAMVVVGVLLYGEQISLSQTGGYTLSLLGFLAYNLAKMGYFDKKSIIASDKYDYDTKALSKV